MPFTNHLRDFFKTGLFKISIDLFEIQLVVKLLHSLHTLHIMATIVFL
jgi:hypothetical protein